MPYKIYNEFPGLLLPGYLLLVLTNILLIHVVLFLRRFLCHLELETKLVDRLI